MADTGSIVRVEKTTDRVCNAWFGLEIKRWKKLPNQI
jgi:hypothetical protein